MASQIDQVLETSSKRLQASHGQNLLPDPSSSTISNVPLTRSHFLDAYSKGKWNLSKVPCPSCFEGVDLISPPEHYSEVSRLKVVKKYINCDQWKERDVFLRLISKALKAFHVNGAAISIIDNNRQVVKYQVSLNISECPRRLSIDAHTILSTGNFVLLDASKDWRTAKNPFVKNVPYIKFYAGVPLVTKFGAVIGAFSVFDSFPRADFERKQIEILRELADEVMTILTSPLKKDRSNTTTSVPLIKIIGRPTSQGVGYSSTVYEKDGSGSPYLQNHNFRYSKHDSSTSNDSLINQSIWAKLSPLRDMKLASSYLGKLITEHSKFDLVCIVEIRVSQRYQISSEYFPNENKIEAESFKYASKLTRIENEQVMTRVLGSFGYDPNDLQFPSGLYYSALSSEFGIFYDSTNSSNIKLRSGICMPFYRIPSKIVRRKKIVRNDKFSNSRSKPIEVYLRSEGFLIAAFNEAERPILEKDMNYIYSAACTLRRIFISN